MPGGSSIRSLSPRYLKATRDEIDQIVRVGSISRFIAHYYQSFSLNSLNWKVAWPNSRKSIDQAHLQSRGISLCQGEQETKGLSATEKKKGRTIASAKPGSRKCRAAALSGRY